MKNNIIAILIIALLALIAIQLYKEPATPMHQTIVNHYDTATHSQTSTPTPIYITPPNIQIINPPRRTDNTIDSAKIFELYYSKLTYADSLFIDSNIIKISDTISQNKITFRKVTLKDLKPRQTIIQSPHQPKLSLLSGLSYNTNQSQIGISAQLQHKKFAAQYSLFASSQSFTILYKFK